MDAGGSKSVVLGAGVGTGLLKVTFLPPSPDTPLILDSSDSHTGPSASTS